MMLVNKITDPRLSPFFLPDWIRVIRIGLLVDPHQYIHRRVANSRVDATLLFALEEVVRPINGNANR